MEGNVKFFGTMEKESFTLIWLWIREKDGMEHLIRASTIEKITKDDTVLEIYSTAFGGGSFHMEKEEDIDVIIQGIAKGGYK